MALCVVPSVFLFHYHTKHTHRHPFTYNTCHCFLCTCISDLEADVHLDTSLYLKRKMVRYLFKVWTDRFERQTLQESIQYFSFDSFYSVGGWQKASSFWHSSDVRRYMEDVWKHASFVFSIIYVYHLTMVNIYKQMLETRENEDMQAWNK